MPELDDLPCQELVELVTAYLDDELDAETQTRFEQHIAHCSGCANYLQQFRQTISLLGSLGVERLSVHGLSNIRRAFRDWAS